MNQQKSAQTRSESNSTPTEHTSGSSSSDADRRGPFTEPTPPSDHDTGPQYSNGSQEAASPESGVEKPFGHMSISKDEISYHGASHWQTILNSISDLKNELGDDEGAEDQATGEELSETGGSSWQGISGHPPQQHSFTELGLLVGSPAFTTKEDLIKGMPEKRVADRLLSFWFNSPDPLKPAIHAPTFQDEYKQYWKDPQRAPVMWLGLTFGILSLAESFMLRDIDPNSAPAKACLTRVNKFHSMAASAAILADYTTPKKYTLECLMFYTAGIRSNDGFMKVWLMIGLILRLSLRMGYHRDPKFYPNISPFEGEMRRRVWTGISMLDILISFQLGLPSMVRTITTDTEPPRNLLDRDFNTSTTALPPGRGIDELTPSSYTRTKVGIVRIFGQAAELGHSTTPVKHEDVMRLDDELASASAAMPSLLKMPDMSELVTDPPEQLMCRINLALLILKTRIILHRNFMLVPFFQLTDDEQARGVGTSKMICTESALSVLNLHHAIHAESQPGGKLYTVKWYMGSISTHDFLLAAMVMCLSLSTQMSEDDELRSTGNQFMCPRQVAMIEALEKSEKIWNSENSKSRVGPSLASSADECTVSNMSTSVEKAGKAMSVMLDRVKQHFKGRMISGSETTCGSAAPLPKFPRRSEQQDNSTAPFYGIVSNAPWADYMPEQPPAQSKDLGAPASAGLETDPLTQANPPFPPTPNPQLDFSTIGDMIDGPMPLDWEIWDDQILQQNAQQGNQANFADQSLDDVNALGGGQRFVAGNAIYANGTGPLVQDDLVGGQFTWQDLQDVDLDIRDYGSGGLWGEDPIWKP